MLKGFLARIRLSKYFNDFIAQQVNERVRLAVRALDDKRDALMLSSSNYPRDRYTYDRDEVLSQALEAWRVNPLARRIVGLTSQYVVGGGISIEARHESTDKFLQSFWTHRLNRMDTRLIEWCDELARSGDLFLVVSTDRLGFSYLRAVPAANIQDIETAENDLEQEKYIYEKPSTLEPESNTLSSDAVLRGKRWTVYEQAEDRQNEDGTFAPVMLHYAINRPVGALWGESDLAPLLRWLSRYANWLEDRVRLNRYRQTFLFWVKARFLNEADRLQRRAELNANPPSPGALLVTDTEEEWSVIQPKLESSEANEDGMALKKMIAAGAGIPMHFLAEPESATRTTAEAAGGPTFRHFEQRQEFFSWLIQDLVRVVLHRRAMVQRSIQPEAELRLQVADISARDNVSLATAARQTISAFLDLRERGLIDDQELLRLAYRFGGEVVDIEEMLKRGSQAGQVKDLRPATMIEGKRNGSEPEAVKIKPVKIDPVTGVLAD